MTEMGMDLLTAAVRSLDEAVLADQPGARYTAAHVAALMRLGVTPHHRRSYAPVINAVRERGGELRSSNA